MNSCVRHAAALVVAMVTFSGPSAIAQITQRVSVSSTGAQGNGNSGNVSISADGRFTAFSSNASNLVAGDTNGDYDTFVHDRVTGMTERVSIATGGAQASSSSFSNSNRISADGRIVVFGSHASNLVAGDTNGKLDIFVRDRSNATTVRVSVDSAGAEANDGSDDAPEISADGRFVAFMSWASNLVAGDTNGTQDVFVRDLQNGTTERVSVDSAGAQGNQWSQRPAISSDGHFVVFDSLASNLVSGDTNAVEDIFIRDRLLGTTERVSVATNGTQGNSASVAYSAISADGRYVAFLSHASNFVAGDTNAQSDIFVRDLTAGTTERVSVASSGAQVINGMFDDGIAISADGRFVAFATDATNLVPNDSNAIPDIFVRDRQSGTTERVSVATGGLGGSDDQSVRPTLSADGRYVAFFSYASFLVAGDTNNFGDAFVCDRIPPLPVVYCTSATTSHGCSPSISANAHPSISLSNPCTLTVASVEGQKTGLIFYGTYNGGFWPSTWGGGSTSWQCVQPPTQRTPIQSSGGTPNLCDGSYALDWNAYQSSHPLSLGNPWSVGAHVFVQAWFRDPPAPNSTSLSNAVELTYVP